MYLNVFNHAVDDTADIPGRGEEEGRGRPTQKFLLVGLFCYYVSFTPKIGLFCYTSRKGEVDQPGSLFQALGYRRLKGEASSVTLSDHHHHIISFFQTLGCRRLKGEASSELQ